MVVERLSLCVACGVAWNDKLMNSVDVIVNRSAQFTFGLK